MRATITTNLGRALALAFALAASPAACSSHQAEVDPPPPPPHERAPAPLFEQIQREAYRHWRTVGVSSMTTPTAGGHCDDTNLPKLAADDGSTLRWIACDDASACTTPTDLHFALPDFASVSDATVTLDGVSSGPDARAAIGCLDQDGGVVGMTPAHTYGPARESHRWEVPQSCLASEDVVVRISRLGAGCLGPDHIGLNVKSTYRRVPLAAVNGPARGPGTCTGACVHRLAEDDGVSLEWISCTAADHFATPTDLHYRVPDADHIDDATLTLRTHTSGADARATISCVDASGLELAQIATDLPFQRAAATYSWAVPKACFASPDVTIRVARTGADCLGPDYVALDVAANARAVSIASIPTRGTCAREEAGCLDNLNRKDDAYLTRWIACDATSGYVTPTDFRFETPEHDALTRAWLVIDTVASDTNARLIGTCVDDEGTTLATIFPETRFPHYKKAQTFDVPKGCFMPSGATKIRLARVGQGCVGPDFLRLYTESSVAPGRIRNAHPIEGYADASSVAPGGTLDLRVHAPKGRFSVEIIRYGATATSMLAVGPIAGGTEDYREDAASLGAGFASSYPLAIPATWPSGLYAARLFDGDAEAFVSFVVREATPGQAPLLLLASTNTWEAYNQWAGKSLYGYWPRDESGRVFPTHLSKKRPRPSATPSDRKGHLTGGDRAINEWLEKSGYPYAELTDDDLNRDPSILSQYEAVIIGSHSEYWTTSMYDGLTDYLGKGGNLLYLGGNAIYWRATMSGDTLEVRKDGSFHDRTGEPGGQWRDLGRPESSVLGVQFEATTGCTKKLSYPYEVLAPAHWAFAGTGVQAGSLIGANGAAGVCGIGAAGWEVDHVTSHTPTPYVLLARGTGTETAHMIYYDHPGGGGVFAVGSLNWARSLSDPTVGAVTENVVRRFMGR